MSYNLNSITNIKCNSKIELLSPGNKNLKDINDLILYNNDIIIYDSITSSLKTKKYTGIIQNNSIITSDISINNNYNTYKIDTRINSINITIPHINEIDTEFIFIDLYGNAQNNNITITFYPGDFIYDEPSILININYTTLH